MSEKLFCRQCGKEFSSQADLFSHNISFEHVSKCSKSTQERANKPAADKSAVPSASKNDSSKKLPADAKSATTKTALRPATSSAPSYRKILPRPPNVWRPGASLVPLFGPRPGSRRGLPPGPPPGLPPGQLRSQPRGLRPGPPHGLWPGQPHQHGLRPGQPHQHGLRPGQPHQRGLRPGQPRGPPPGPPPGLPPCPPLMNLRLPATNHPIAPPRPPSLDFTSDSVPSQGEQGSFSSTQRPQERGHFSSVQLPQGEQGSSSSAPSPGAQGPISGVQLPVPQGEKSPFPDIQLPQQGKNRKHRVRRGRGQANKRRFIAMVLEARTILADRGLRPEFPCPVTQDDFNMYRRVMQSCLKRKVYPSKRFRRPKNKKLFYGNQAQSASILSGSTAQCVTATPAANSLLFQSGAQQGSSSSFSLPPSSSKSEGPDTAPKSGSDVSANPTSLLKSGEVQQGSNAPDISTSSASAEEESGKSTSRWITGSSSVVKRLQEANRPRFISGLGTAIKAKTSGPVSATKILKKAKDTQLSKLAGKRAPIVDTVPRLLPPLAASRLRRKIPGSETVVLPKLPFPDGMDFLPLEVTAEREKSGNDAILQGKTSVGDPVEPSSIAPTQPKSEVLSPASEPSVEGSANTRDDRHNSSCDLDSTSPPPPALGDRSSQESLLPGEPLQMDLDTEESSQEQLSPTLLADATPPKSATTTQPHPSSDSLRPIDSALSAVAVSVPRIAASQTKRIVSSFVTALPTPTGSAPISRNLTNLLKDTSLVLASVGDSECEAQQLQKAPSAESTCASNSSAVAISDQAERSSTSSSSVLPQSSINAMIEKVLQDMHNHLPVPGPVSPNEQGPDTVPPAVNTSPGSRKRKSTVPRRRAVVRNKSPTDEKPGKTKSVSKDSSKKPEASPTKKRGTKVSESGPQKRKRSADAGVLADGATPPEDPVSGSSSVQDSLRQRVFFEARKLKALGCPLPHQKQNRKMSQNQITSLGQRPRKMSESDTGNLSSPSDAADAPLSPGVGSSASGQKRRPSSAVSPADEVVPSPTETRNTVLITVTKSFNPDIIHQNPIVAVANSAVPRSGHSTQPSKSSTSESVEGRPGSAKRQKTTARRRRSSAQLGGPEGGNRDVHKSMPAAAVGTPEQSVAASKPPRPDTLTTGARESLQPTSSEQVHSPLLHSQSSSAPAVKIEPISPSSVTDVSLGGPPDTNISSGGPPAANISSGGPPATNISSGGPPATNITSGGPSATDTALQTNTSQKCTWQQCHKPVHHLNAKLCLEHDRFVDSIMTRLKSSQTTDQPSSSGTSATTPGATQNRTTTDSRPVFFGEIANAPSWLGLPSQGVGVATPPPSRSTVTPDERLTVATGNTESDRRLQPSEKAKMPPVVIHKAGAVSQPPDSSRTSLQSPRSRGSATPSFSTTSGRPTESSNILSRKLPKTGKSQESPRRESGSGIGERGVSSTAPVTDSSGAPLAKKQRITDPLPPDTSAPSEPGGVATHPLPVTPQQGFMAEIIALNAREQQLQAELLSGQTELCEVCEKAEEREKELRELKTSEQRLRGRAQQLTSESLEVLGQKQNLLLHSSAKGKGGGGASAQAQRGSEEPSATQSQSFQSEMASLNQREQQLQAELLSGQSELCEVCEKAEEREKELRELRTSEQRLQALCSKLTSEYKEVLARKQTLLLQPLQGTPSPLSHVAGNGKSVADSFRNTEDGNGTEADPGSRSRLESNPAGGREKGLIPVGEAGLESKTQDRGVDDSNPEGAQSRPTPGLVPLSQGKVEGEGGQVVRKASEHSRPVLHRSESFVSSQSERRHLKVSRTHEAAKSSSVPSCDRREVGMTTKQKRTLSSSERRISDATPPPRLSLYPCPLIHPVPSPSLAAGPRVEEMVKKLGAGVGRASPATKTVGASNTTTEKESVVRGGTAKDKEVVEMPQGAGEVQRNIEDRGGEASSSKRASDGDGGSTKAVPRFEPHGSSVLSMAISGNRLYTCSADKTVRAYNRQTGAIEQQYKDHQRSVTCLELFTNNGITYLLTGSSDKMIHMYNTKNQKLEAKFKCGVRVMYLSVYETMLFVGLSSGTVIVIDLVLNRCIGRHSCHHSDTRCSISCLCSCEERLFTAAFDMKVACWRVVPHREEGVSFQLEKLLTSFKHTVLCMKIHDKLLYSGCGDATVQIHHTTTWELVHTITAHGGAVSALDILGKVLITACFDKLVRCFDTEHLELLQVYAGNTDMVFTLCTADGLIYTGLKDGTVQAHRLDLTVFNQCHWQGCGLRFGVWEHLREHIRDHAECKSLTPTPANTVTCHWKGCSQVIDTQLMTAHLQLHVSLHQRQ